MVANNCRCEGEARSNLVAKAGSTRFACRLADYVRNDRRGQAAIEMALSLPFLIWLLYYTINGFYSIHTAHVAQKYAAMNLWQRVNNRSKFVMDDFENNGQGQLHNREFMGVRYTETDGTLPRRRIITGPIPIFNIIGICREPGCTQ